MWLIGNLLSPTIVLILNERFIVPWLYKLKLTSTFEYLEMRFQSKAVRRLASANGILISLFYTGVALLGPSVAMQVAVGFDMKTSCILMASFCTVYTALGGMRAVVWTDVLQGIIMFGGMFFILVQGMEASGGLKKVIDISKSEGRVFFGNFSPDPNIRLSVWSLLIGGRYKTLHTDFKAS